MNSLVLPLAFLALLAHPCLASLQDPQSAQAEKPVAGLRLRTDEASEGYTLICPLRSKTTLLLDMQGEVVHRWESEYAPGNSVYLQDNGRLLRACRLSDTPVFSGGGQGGMIQEHEWDGTVTWEFRYADEEHLHHHDFAPLPSGNVLLIAWEMRTNEQAIAAGRDPAQLGDKGFWPDFVVEIEPIRPEGGKVVWEWHAWDHLIQDFDPEGANHGDVTAHPERIDINGDHRREPPMTEAQRLRQLEIEREMKALGYAGDEDEDEATGGGARRRRAGGDWLHTNSIDYDPDFDLILLSVRRMSEVWVIDHSTTTAQAAGRSGGRFGKGGDLLYRWGNPRTYGAGTAADRRLFLQHDAQWVPGPELAFTVFNNGEGRPGKPWSTVDEVVISFDEQGGFLREPGSAFQPVDASWTYAASDKHTFFSSFISGAQRLPNGNTLICSGAQARIFEINSRGEVVWDYHNEHGGDVTEGSRGPGGRRPGGPGGGRGAAGGGRGGPGMNAKGLFRATRLPTDHPGLAGKDL